MICDDKNVVPDLAIYSLGEHVYTDFSITHAASPSIFLKTKERQGVAASIREQEKSRKYKSAIEKLGPHAKFFPFVAETYGHLGAGAINFLKMLNRAVVDANPDWRMPGFPNFFNYAASVVSVALQRGNAESILQYNARHAVVVV